MATEKRIRVLLSKLGLDAHEIGIRYIAKTLRDKGIEVIYLGLYHTCEEVVASAIQEDVDVIGLSILGGEHLVFTDKVVNLLKKEGKDIPVIVGGAIPEVDVPALNGMGARAVFLPGSFVEDIYASITDIVAEKESSKAK